VDPDDGDSLVAMAIPSSPTCISYGMSYTIFSKPFNYGQEYNHSCHYKKLLYFKKKAAIFSYSGDSE
jgi:hypothetical protein